MAAESGPAVTTLVATGVASEGSNASRTPALPVGWAEGDLLLCLAAIRNSGAGVPNAPAGYSTLLDMSNARVFGKIATGSETDPTVTFTGGVANATCHAQMAAFRGPDVLTLTGTPAALLNASAQNIAYPAGPALTRQRVLTIAAWWKQDDWTTAVGPGTVIGTTSTTTGDDAGIGWSYGLRTTALPSGSVVVTGGAAAISRGGSFNLIADPVVALTVQDSWPPRAQIAVTNLEDGDVVEIYRVTGGEWTAVRAGSRTVTDPSFVVIDAEMPFGVPVTYAVLVNGWEYDTDVTTFELLGGQVALSDAITGAVAECVIAAAGEKTYGRDSARFRAGGKNLVVMGPAPTGGEGSYELLAMTTSGADGIRWLLRNATEGIVQIRQPGISLVTGEPYDGIDAYLAVDQHSIRRFSQDGSDPRRIITIQFAEVDGWAPGLEARGFTLQDIADYFGVSGTLQDIADFNGSGGTLLDIALADWTP